MSLYLSRLLLNPANGNVRHDISDCQALHRSVMSAFRNVEDDAARKSLAVLHQLEVTEKPLHISLLVQSAENPDWSHLPQGYIMPEGIRQREISLLLEKFKEGGSFRFRLMANPTKKTGGSLKSERLNGMKTNAKRIPVPAEEQMDWLRRQGTKYGFIVHEGTMVVGKENLTGFRGKDTGMLRHAAVQFLGSLRITDVDKFVECIREGVGAGKAYGLGMLQILGRIG